MKLKQTDIFNFNVDEIELYGTFSNYETLIEGVNSTNSDFIKFLDFTVKKSDNLKDYHFKLDFWKNNHPCYAFYIGKQINAKIKTRDYFIVYGSAFKIIELNEIVDFIDTYIELDYIDQKKGNKFNTLKRFDLAIDIKKEISGILKNFTDLKQRGLKYFGNRGELETYYIGEYKNRDNKRLLIRIYDKIKDIKKKGKQDLYSNYLLEENITRIELEFRKELISSIKLSQLLDRSYIYNLLILYLNKHTKIFENIKTEEVAKLKATNKKVNLEELKYDDILKDRYINSFLGYARNILKIGSCPVDILLSKSVFYKYINMNLIGLIYCRVSSQKQVKEGNGLSSQEKRCRDYAQNSLGIGIEKVFNDEGVSGGLFERKSIRELFNYIDENKKNNYIVIFEDLNRLSRDIQVHGLLKAEFKKRGVELASPNFQFEESPEGDFKENISVVVAQYEKDKNKQRVISRMKARLEQGFWCFKEPLGYKFIDSPTGGRIMVKDKEIASIIKSGLEKYSKGEIITLVELGKYFYKRGLNIGGISSDGEVTSKSVIHRIATNLLYSGQLECEKFGIGKLKAKHEGIISIETYDNIQNKLKSMSQKERYIESNLTRKDLSADFPLRGLLYCEKSGGFFSGAWSKGYSRKMPYYTYSRKSPLAGKSINRDEFHEYFYEYLKSIKPSKELIKTFEELLKHEIEIRNKDRGIYNETLKKELKTIDTKISSFITRIGNTNSEVLISNYEKEIEKLEKEKIKILNNLNSPTKNVRTGVKHKLKMFEDSLTIWKKGKLENKKILLKNIFPEGIPINEKKQVRTANLSLIYQAFETGKVSNFHLVELDGFEPTS